ncbi:pyridoxamine 5'-phosphate oxidase family protein [Actinoplanes subtropicus]|uniref:pyridoxamine 5'-phosphate oxidase family protein n=1 Tax=Actinoplanes subtropicus TaxID=543632 RepID=UPI0004C35B34|nr:pyridoxamine 5'-phosphate oxidase family protein [Actinoplanes subtropicus]
MLENAEEIAALQLLLDRSHAGATSHLRNIVHAGRTLTAEDLTGLLTGMKVLSVATVTARGEPRISALDGHFLHATWTFSTAGAAAKARHLERRPAVSVAHIDGEEFAVFSHGRAERIQPDDDGWKETLEHWTAYYDSSPLSWGEDVRMYRLRPHWMVGYASDRLEVLSRRGVSPS